MGILTQTLFFPTASFCLDTTATLFAFVAGVPQNQRQNWFNWSGDAPNDGEVQLIASRGGLCFVSTSASPGRAL